jgi:hypothetical protein
MVAAERLGIITPNGRSCSWPRPAGADASVHPHARTSPNYNHNRRPVQEMAALTLAGDCVTRGLHSAQPLVVRDYLK